MTAARTPRRSRTAKPKVRKVPSAPKIPKTLKAPKLKVWKLKLYVAGASPKSVRAFANLKVLCEQHLKGQYQIEVIDLLEHPHLARGEQIVAIPTLVIKLPDAVQKIIGDLSDTDRVLIGLALQPIG